MFHSQSVHKLDPKPYKCRICYKSFSNSSYLSQHNRIHLGIKPFKCRVCERKFTQHCHLMQHMRYVCLFRLIYACLEFATVLPWKCSEESLNSHIRINFQADLYHLRLCADVILDKSISPSSFTIFQWFSITYWNHIKCQYFVTTIVVN